MMSDADDNQKMLSFCREYDLCESPSNQRWIMQATLPNILVTFPRIVLEMLLLVKRNRQLQSQSLSETISTRQAEESPVDKRTSCDPLMWNRGRGSHMGWFLLMNYSQALFYHSNSGGAGGILHCQSQCCSRWCKVPAVKYVYEHLDYSLSAVLGNSRGTHARTHARTYILVHNQTLTHTYIHTLARTIISTHASP